jgi:tetratricopeptide (TPR) repeat protein
MKLLKTIGFLIILSQNCFSMELSNIFTETLWYEFNDEINKEAVELFEMSKIKIYNNDYVVAERLLISSLELDNNFYEALSLLGIVYLFQEKDLELNNITNQFILLIENNPNNRSLYYHLAEIYEQQKEYIKIINLFQRLLEIESRNNNVYVYYNIGIMYYEIKEFEISNEYLLIAYKYMAEEGYLMQYEVVSILGANYYFLGNYQEALKYFERLFDNPLIERKNPILLLLINIIKEKI